MLWPDENQMKTYSQPERRPFAERALAQMSEGLLQRRESIFRRHREAFSATAGRAS